jgi:hypothetical protein
MSTDDQTPASGSVTVKAGAFSQVLADVLPHITDDFELLRVVCLRAADGTLTATATDRYTLGQSRIACVGDAIPDRTLISSAHAKFLSDLLAPMRDRSGPAITIGVSDGVFRLTWQDFSVPGMPQKIDLSLSTKNLQDFPVYEKLLDHAAQQTANLAGPIGLNPTLLARFAVPCRWNDVPEFHVRTATSTVLVRIGDHFTGLIMPVRLAGGRAAQAGDEAA